MDKIDLLNKMVLSNPKDSGAWYLLGMEYSQNKNVSKAIEAYTEALKYCDDNMKKDIINALESLSKISGADKTSFFHNETRDKLTDISSKSTEEINEKLLNDKKVIPLRVMNGEMRRTLPVDEERSEVTFAEVGGLDDLKETIRMKIIRPFSIPGLFEKFRKKSGGGILLFGPPGCGKTFIAKATAGECRAKFIPVNITDILDPYLGVSAKNIKDVFIKAREEKPCILFFDEIDTLGFNRAKLSGEYMRPVIDELLSQMEGVDSSTDKMLVIGATNMILLVLKMY